MNLFVTAIHTDSGKTLVSAILCRAFHAEYWKPVQSGAPYDSETIRVLAGKDVLVHPERYRLKTPESPHASAAKDSVEIKLNELELPKTKKPLIIEGAGGCLVPLNKSDFVIDIAVHLKCPVILVSNIYLGSINHTLLTAEALKARNIQVKGLIFNGGENIDTESIILLHTGLPCLLKIPRLEKVTSEEVDKFATILRETWNQIY